MGCRTRTYLKLLIRFNFDLFYWASRFSLRAGRTKWRGEIDTLRPSMSPASWLQAEALSYLRDRIIRHRPPAARIIKTPEQCSETLLSYKRIGVGDFMLDIVDATKH